jgi:hypothetical protein
MLMTVRLGRSQVDVGGGDERLGQASSGKDDGGGPPVTDGDIPSKNSANQLQKQLHGRYDAQEGKRSIHRLVVAVVAVVHMESEVLITGEHDVRTTRIKGETIHKAETPTIKIVEVLKAVEEMMDETRGETALGSPLAQE